MGKINKIILWPIVATSLAIQWVWAEKVKNDTNAQIQELMTKCDKNKDGAIKWIFEKKCYLKGKNILIKKDIAKNREDIAKSDENIAKNREDIAKNREDIAKLNEKGQQMIDEMKANAWISN